MSAQNLKQHNKTTQMQSISACMGHASTKTQDYYGRFNHKGGGLCPDTSKTKVSRPVRVTGGSKLETNPSCIKIGRKIYTKNWAIYNNEKYLIWHAHSALCADNRHRHNF